MYEFKSSLSIGKERENEVLQLIKKKYKTAFIINGYNKGADIYIPEINTYVEVKQDYKSHYTDNFLIEIEYNSSPSGLAATKSDWWVIVDRDYYIWIKTDDLKYLIRELHLRIVTISEKEKRKKLKAYLVSTDIFQYLPYALVVKRKIAS